MSAKFRPRNYFSRGCACSLQSAIKLSLRKMELIWFGCLPLEKCLDSLKMSAVSVSSFCGLFSKAIAATFLVMNNSQAFVLLEGLVASAVIFVITKEALYLKRSVLYSSTFEKGTRIVSRLMKPFRYPKLKLRDIFSYTFWPRRRKLPNL